MKYQINQVASILKRKKKIDNFWAIDTRLSLRLGSHIHKLRGRGGIYRLRWWGRIVCINLLKQYKNMSKFLHQGDITFIKVADVDIESEKHDGSFIVGFGEATGHHHRVTVQNPQDMEIVKVADGFILRVKSKATITHEEHKSLILSPGTYRIGHEREMDWFSLATRNVID